MSWASGAVSAPVVVPKLQGLPTVVAVAVATGRLTSNTTVPRMPVVLGADGLPQQLQAIDALVQYQQDIPPSLGAVLPLPPATGVRLFCRTLARSMLSYLGAGAVEVQVQPFMGRGRIGLFQPQAGTAALPGVSGYPTPTAVGTATARIVDVSGYFVRLRRLGYVSAATAGSLTGSRVPIGLVTLGTTLGGVRVGGFHKVIQFGCSDAATVAGARQFVGVAVAAAPTNVEPSTLTNVIGVGHGAADATLSLYFGGTTAQAPVALGASFPANTLSVDAYELSLYCAAGSTVVTWQVTRMNTGAVASGTLSDATGVVLPSAATLLSPHHAWRCNNATALAVGLDVVSDYFETEC